jgi:hypothetical protein
MHPVTPARFRAPHGRLRLPGGRQVCRDAGDELGQEPPPLPFLDALEVRAALVTARRTTIAGLPRGEAAADSAIVR